MESNTIDVTNPQSWLERGRSAAEAEALATAWRNYPDLPITAPADDRMARTRARTVAMRPIFEAMRERTENERQAKNFAFVIGQVERGQASEQDRAILRGQADHGYDWDCAVHYAQGWYAASAGWNHRADASSHRAVDRRLADAYDRGFADGGGDTADLFDAARRANIAAERAALSIPPAEIPSGKLKPSLWPLPSDEHRPVSWGRRLIVMTDQDLLAPIGRDSRPTRRPSALALAQERSASALTIVVLSAEAGFVESADAVPSASPMSLAQADALISDPAHQDMLKALIGAGDFDEMLVTAQGEYLRVLDAFSPVIPVLRTMERTRNTPLQQRAHLETWLARGRAPGENVGAGHIRWGKATKSLTGKLGEFTVRYIGAAADRGHLVKVTLEDGTPADGYVLPDHTPLQAVVRISSKSRLKHEMARVLRSFGGATRLGGQLAF